MALIKLGGLVTKISGKIGGQSLGTSASGSYIKNSGTPRKSITVRQRSQMALMGTTAQRWRALTQAQRDVFNSASPDYPYINRVGETKFYSGYAIFGQLQNFVSFSDPPGLPVPLPKFNFTPLTNIEFIDAIGDLEMEADAGQAGVSYRLWTTRIMSEGITSGYKNKFFIGKDTPDGSGNVNINVANNYYARWGPLPLSGKMFWRIDAVHLATGQVYKALNSGVHFYSP